MIVTNNIINLKEAPLAKSQHCEANIIKIDVQLNNIGNIKSEKDKKIKSTLLYIFNFYF